jgi:lipopolysaccharide/colanic/teichoic acid biosynthesis glycosyltransferase
MYFDFIKRTIDIVGSLFGLIIFSPLFLILALGIKLSSRGPIFFKPERIGKNGKLFAMCKFRSMNMYKINGKLEHAHEILKRDRKMFEEYKSNSFKLKNDPRVTSFGKFLRKSSLDELPQLLNILNGEMSLVGPRAYLPDELEEQQKVFPETKPLVKTLLKCKPGLTGYWQVSGRSDINFDKRIKMDVSYYKRRSILYDLELILRTFPAIFTARGAV